MNQSATDKTGEQLLATSTSLKHFAQHLIRATVAIGVAYVLGRIVVDLILGRSTFGQTSLLIEAPVHVAIATMALSVSSAFPILREMQYVKRSVTRNERELARRSVGQKFLGDVHQAFEMVATEDELFEISGVALGEMATSEVGGSEILVADSSNAHVEAAVVADVGSAPGCGVLTPGSCPAVTRGQTLKFADPNGLSSCPQLRKRQLGEGIGATCIPITVLGTPSAVLHSTYEFVDSEAAYEKKVAILEGVSVKFGARLGMLRAMSQSQLQADTDPLTGLLNRRAMENRVRELRADGVQFGVAMMDLDHFKRLNDTFGHDTGDRALRLFSRILNENARDSDIVCRHGGEEFVVILPGTDVTTAAPVFHRLRANLAAAISSSQVPPFTVSIGLCDSTWSDDLQELLNSADRALMQAKQEGRDRLIIDDSALLSRPGSAAEPASSDLELSGAVSEDLLGR